MKKQIKTTIALLLVLVQLFVLFPVLQPQAQAAGETQSQDPVLNPVIEGTVRFGSFNYTGDKGTDAAGDERDGVDYVSTFYYSDDYFSRSAVNPNATRKTMDWTDLEDRSMATLSKDFTIAAYGSSENTFPTDWTHKDKNGLRFLKDCGFTAYASNSDFNKQTEADTIGAVFGSKVITVYDQTTGKNDTFTLIAIGVRGAGYGAEWASNLTIGNSASATQSNSGTYRHYGFDRSADKVMTDLDAFLQINPIRTTKAKYWVVGYSRAGAVADLVAARLSDDNYSKYKTGNDHVYGYTYEAAAAALKSEDPNGAKYKNIHNIVNKMDAVPLVSPDLFNHARLGVDYYLPYYKYNNAQNPNITAYYNRMYEALKKVAVIADLYNGNVNQRRDSDGNLIDHTEDPTLTDANPNTYPYNKAIQIYSFGITKITNGFVDTVSNSGSTIAKNYTGFKGRGNGMMMDEFLAQLVEKAMKSIAWDQDLFEINEKWYPIIGTQHEYLTDNMTSDALRHEWRYVVDYQEGFRTLAEGALKQPGFGLSALNGITDKLMDAGVGDLITSLIVNGLYYGSMNTNFRFNWAVYHLSDNMTELMQKVVKKLDLFDNTIRTNGKTDLDRANEAIATIMPPLTWLYSLDHRDYNAEYLGTAFGNVSKILVTHIPELGVSWLMSLDDVFLSDYREITLPKNTAVTMKVVREGIDYQADSDLQFVKSNWGKNADVPGAEVATFLNGEKLTSKDDRITVADSGDNFVIRYPGNLDVRFEVTAAGERIADVPLALADFTPGTNIVNVKSTCTRAGANDAEGLNESNIKTVSIDHAMTQYHHTVDADAVNGLTADIPLSGSDTLNIMSWHGSNQVVDKYDTTYYVSLDKAPRSIIAEYTMETVLADNVKELPEGTDENLFSINDSDQLVWKFDPATSTASYAPIGERTFTAYNLTGLQSAAAEKAESVVSEGVYSTRQTVSVVPASSVYYDDTLLEDGVSVDAKTASPNYESIIETLSSDGTTVDSSHLVAFKFTGTRIDLFMNTDENTGGVAAYLLNEDGTERIAGQLVAGKSDNELYNVPVVSFKQDECKTYTLTIVVGAGKSFQLDGVRIYDTTRAAYASVRDSLISTADWTGQGQVTGTVYLDYEDNGSARLKDYDLSGPKGEVYLKPGKPGTNGNGVAFTIKDFDAAASYRIGLSAVDGTSVWVKINNDTPFEVTSSTHMFYDLNLSGPNVVIRAVDGEGILSVTDVEMTPLTLGASHLQEVKFSVSPELVEYAASLSMDAAPEETAEPTPDPTPDLSALVQELISSFVQSLFGSISRLFGN